MSPSASSVEPSDSRPSRVNLDEIAQVLAAQSTQPQPQPPNRPEEQALESHEVIELQTFSERKAWIEEKIKFLESLPPIEVFAGLEAVKASSLDVPGLPTREELQRWAAEHDTIEKETEMFDTGELKKLRQLTKAATQRNLSPEDTDVIELTLTTIYALDKLLHLLRNRSDSLDMLGIRLTWEEHRQAAWVERQQIIDDLRNFCATRARWTPSVYEQGVKSDDSPQLTRRSSVTSFASVSSEPSISSAAFSRSARFKLAELLSRDAASFTGRVVNLRHGKVVAAGKALDKLIDHSRKPVPEELLDEQDKVEEKCISQLETIGKFTMSLVMQWRKADEVYVETMKDNAAAANLLEEIETAKLNHPTARQTAAFSSRLDTILKRLSVRGDPALSASMFPCPENPLFPDQRAANEAMVRRLSDDIKAATTLARKVENVTKEYKKSFEAVKNAESLVDSSAQLAKALQDVVVKYQNGVTPGDSEGSPPDLTCESSLDQNSHSVFLALLPTLHSDLASTIQKVDALLREAPVTLFDMDQPNIDVSFKQNVHSQIQRLRELRAASLQIRDERAEQAKRLREARKVAASIQTHQATLLDILVEMKEGMQQERWKHETTGTDTPPTPQTPPTMLLPNSLGDNDFQQRIDQVTDSMSTNVRAPLSNLSPVLEKPLHSALQRDLHNLDILLENGRKMFKCLVALRHQSSTMKEIREDFNRILLRIEDSKMEIEDAIEDILADRNVEQIPPDSELHANIDAIRSDVQLFTNELSSRVPFISKSLFDPSEVLNRPSTSSGKGSQPAVLPAFPFDLVNHDAGVRADGNSFVMRLSGRVQNLLQSKAHLGVAKQAKEVDSANKAIDAEVSSVLEGLDEQRAIFTGIVPRVDSAAESYRTCLKELEAMRSKRQSIARSVSPTRGLLRRMEEASRSLDGPARETLFGARNRAFDGVEQRLALLEQSIATVHTHVSKALEDELRYQEAKKLEEEKQVAEAERRRREEEEARERAERERLSKEQERLHQEQLAKQREEELVRQRATAEVAEQQRLRVEAERAEELRRIEEQRLAELARADHAEEKEALALAAQRRQEEEKKEVLARLRMTEAELDEQRRLHAESKRSAADLASRRDKDVEDLERRLKEAERLKEEQARKSAEAALLSRRKGHFRQPSTIAEDEGDVFGPQSPNTSRRSQELRDLQGKILSLRKRLRSLHLSEFLKPTNDLPTASDFSRLKKAFDDIESQVQKLPASSKERFIDVELDALRAEVELGSMNLADISKLVDFLAATQLCEAALSDLLEHIDSFPAIPLGVLSSAHRSDLATTPVEQMSARRTFTKETIDEMIVKFKLVAHDKRAVAESNRINQTWMELEEMSAEKLKQKSPSPSVASSSRPSSGRTSSVSVTIGANTSARANRKKHSYSNLSVSSVASVPSRPGMLAPPAPRASTSRLATSTAKAEPPSRSNSRMSSISSRSVSGPNASTQGTTFSSRQRTASLSGNSAPIPPVPTARRPSMPPSSRTRLNSDTRRSKSPMGDHSSQSQASRSSGSTWSRAPRDSLSRLVQRGTTPVQKMTAPPVRKKYIADPKNKLDVAVGEVINDLPVGINIEGVTESWKDLSGKYWIGNQDPKLCFCRILRSQTVMVRVGGGWQELSKFIKDHFAESFRVLSPSPQQPGAVEDKWISSATLLQAQTERIKANAEHPDHPRTPEPSVPFLPSVSLTPSGPDSPRSIRSITPSAKGSPLTPLQFMRRADSEAPTAQRPSTPSKPSRGRLSLQNNPSRSSREVWRP